ncbi:hypothetical protein [Halobacillus litoralis]|uniref:hypothetical protein n=1 Tax=Halobacillus litoralis TaxID=45668 RepID=UPI001CD4A913|nr:hypothetical protein [Halobacillus litoralis]MCA1021573.1 hypothetical protein [Halobacillus litoralis]
MKTELLRKVEDALDSIVDHNDVVRSVNLTFAELRAIRRYELIEERSTQLSAENLREGLKLRKTR